MSSPVRLLRYVGSRTTFRAINNKWTRSFTRALAKEGKHAAMKLIPPDSKRATSLLCFGKGVLKTFVTLRRSLPKDRRVYYITDQECCSYTLQARMERHGFGPYSGGHTMPSGFEGLFFMLQICDELDVYGFDPQIDEDVKYHYFDNIKVAPRCLGNTCGGEKRSVLRPRCGADVVPRPACAPCSRGRMFIPLDSRSTSCGSCTKLATSGCAHLDTLRTQAAHTRGRKSTSLRPSGDRTESGGAQGYEVKHGMYH